MTTRPHAEVARALAARLDRPCVVVSHRADLARELERLLARGPVCFVGTDPRFAARLRAWYAASPDGAHVRPVILGGDTAHDADALAAIPDGAPAYVMRTARDRLGGVPTRLHALSTLRAFSRETREALLRLIVARNLAAAP